MYEAERKHCRIFLKGSNKCLLLLPHSSLQPHKVELSFMTVERANIIIQMKVLILSKLLALRRRLQETLLIVWLSFNDIQ